MFLVLVKQRFADFIDRWLTLQVVVVVVVADFLTGLPTLFFTVAELPVEAELQLVHSPLGGETERSAYAALLISI